MYIFHLITVSKIDHAIEPNIIKFNFIEINNKYYPALGLFVVYGRVGYGWTQAEIIIINSMTIRNIFFFFFRFRMVL